MSLNIPIHHMDLDKQSDSEHQEAEFRFRFWESNGRHIIGHCLVSLVAITDRSKLIEHIGSALRVLKIVSRKGVKRIEHFF